MTSWTHRLLVVMILFQMTGCAPLVIGTGAAGAGLTAHDRRSFGTVIDDNLLELRVTDAIYGEPEFDTRDRIKITAFNGWVLLAGEAATADRVERVGGIVEEVKGVRRVINELAAEPKAGPGTRSHDTWLNTRVKTALMGIDLPGFDATRVNVTTTRDIVYLLGLVTTGEAEAVTEKARRVRGVDRVVTAFEYIEDVPGPSDSGS